MTRHQIISSAKQIAEAIKSAGISSIPGTSDDEMTLQDYLLAYKNYNIVAEKFSPGAVFLENELGFAELRDPNPWILMSKTEEDDERNPLVQVRNSLDTLNSLADLLKKIFDGSSTGDHRETLTLILIEQENELKSSPRRISESLKGIELLYESCARLEGLPFEDLEVVSCDSGHEKRFDFSGDDALIRATKDLVLSIWERVVFYRNKNLQERISLLTHSLPILDNIAEREMDGQLTGEEGETARTTVISGVAKFLDSGSIIEEIQQITPVDQRSLISLNRSLPDATGNGHEPAVVAPEPGFPTSGLKNISEALQFDTPEEPVNDTGESAEDDYSWDGILEDDLKTLRELIDKTKRGEEEPG